MCLLAYSERLPCECFWSPDPSLEGLGPERDVEMFR